MASCSFSAEDSLSVVPSSFADASSFAAGASAGLASAAGPFLAAYASKAASSFAESY
jgi:hypothetical protein